MLVVCVADFLHQEMVLAPTAVFYKLKANDVVKCIILHHAVTRYKCEREKTLNGVVRLLEKVENMFFIKLT